MRDQKRKASVLCLIGTAILWSLGGVFIKGVTWNSMGIASGRSLIAALTIALFMGKPSLKFTKARIGAIVCYAGVTVSFVMATKMTTAANAILLQYTAPIYTALLSIWLLKEPVHKKDILSIGIILGGMVLFFIDSLKIGNFSGDILALFAGVCFGFMHVFMRMEKDNDPMQSTFWGNILAFCITLPFVGQLEWSINNMAGVLFLGIFQIGIAYVLYSKAIPHVSALEAVLIPIIEPILNPVWVMLIQKEVPSVYAIIGGIIVVAGATFKTISLKDFKKNKEEKVIEG